YTRSDINQSVLPCGFWAARVRLGWASRRLEAYPMPTDDRPSRREPIAGLAVMAFTEEIKPRLRGWSHALASVGAVAATIALLIATAYDPPRFLSLLVFGLSLIALYLVSAIYHLGTWQGRTEIILLAFDH